MPHTVTIYGASDDLIEVEGNAPGCDEYNLDHGVFILTGPEGFAARVGIEFAEGSWEIAVAQVSADTPLLPMRLDSAGYTVRATVEGVALVTHEAAK